MFVRKMGLSFLEQKRLEAMSVHEKALREQGFVCIAGVDEAGRGPLAGPVFAAACILPEGTFFAHLNDSKQLTADLRETLYAQITTHPGVVYSIASASVAEIDRYNILKATFLAMRRAVQALTTTPDYLLIDGNQVPAFEMPVKAIVEGDGKSLSIAAASILAKVMRDRWMVQCDAKWPGYGFKQHKGYGTEAHLAALQEKGPCPIHRKTFDPVKSHLAQQQIHLF